MKLATRMLPNKITSWAQLAAIIGGALLVLLFVGGAFYLIVANATPATRPIYIESK